MAVVPVGGQARFRQPHLGVAVPDGAVPFGTGQCEEEAAAPDGAGEGRLGDAADRPLVSGAAARDGGDGAFASLELFRALRGDAVCVARCRMDARFFNPPTPRKNGQKGRPRVVGTRQLTPKTRSIRKTTQWVRMIIPGWRAEDGMTGRDVDVATGTALWNSRGITLPVRWVLNPGSGWTRRDAHFR